MPAIIFVIIGLVFIFWYNSSSKQVDRYNKQWRKKEAKGIFLIWIAGHKRQIGDRVTENGIEYIIQKIASDYVDYGDGKGGGYLYEGKKIS
jgi:hypothetical protein